MRQSDMGIFRRHHRSLSDGPCLHHVEGMEKPLFPVRGYRPDIRFPLDEMDLCGGNEIRPWGKAERSGGGKTGKSAQRKEKAGGNRFSAQWPMLALIMAAIVMQGILRDGITTWMPSYVSDTFHLDSSISILTGVVLPVFSIICLELVSVLNRKMIQNELICAATVFFAGFCGALLLAFLPSFGVGLSISLAALVTGCMYGVNVILVSMIPPYFKNSGNVSAVSGLLNACTYVGSALSSYGIALVAQGRGWGRFCGCGQPQRLPEQRLVWAAESAGGDSGEVAEHPGTMQRFASTGETDCLRRLDETIPRWYTEKQDKRRR